MKSHYKPPRGMFTDVKRVKTRRSTHDQGVILSELNRRRMAVCDINRVISETNTEFDKIRPRSGSKH